MWTAWAESGAGSQLLVLQNIRKRRPGGASQARHSRAADLTPPGHAPPRCPPAEVHQTLTTNGLRERVSLRCDGGMRSGRDVLVTAALGADEYGFGTVAMIATGCIMARVCHTNNCPVGVASQREELRARFPGAWARSCVWSRGGRSLWRLAGQEQRNPPASEWRQPQHQRAASPGLEQGQRCDVPCFSPPPPPPPCRHP